LNNIKLIDSHVNFGHELLAENSKSIIRESIENNIIGMLCVNSNLLEFSNDLKIIADYDLIDITIGHHPNYVNQMNIIDIESLLDENLRENSRIVAVGETGLDFYYDSEKKQTN